MVGSKMSRFRVFEIVERRRPYFVQETANAFFLNPPAFPTAGDDLQFHNSPPFFFDEFDAIQIETPPFRRLEPQLQALCDRVSELEMGFERLKREDKVGKKTKTTKKKKLEDKKYSWTAEMKTAEKHHKYNCSAEIQGGEDEKKSYKWTAQIKGKGCPDRTYTVEVSSGGECAKHNKNKVKDTGKSAARTIQIEDPSHHGAVVLRQAFTKRPQKKKGKGKELSPQDAAALIQISFRAYLIRRSQALRALRELAIAKNKLKEIRTLFNNFSYRRRISREAEERQRFSEKIIVLLLTVDAIEGADVMVRAAKKSMVDELEAMLDVVDPQPPGKSSFMRRRTFDMPDGVINKELAAGVAKVIEMLDDEEEEEESTAS